MIIEKIAGRFEDISDDGLVIDKVILDHDDISRPHQKVKTEGGEKLAEYAYNHLIQPVGDILHKAYGYIV